jgi:hypothetical protein
VGFTRTLREDVGRLEVGGTDNILVQGAVREGTVASGGALTVQGAIINLRVQSGGALVCHGAIIGEVSVDEDGFCLVQGVVLGTIRNAGRLVADVAPQELGGQIINAESGQTLTRDDLPPEMRSRIASVQTRIT